MEKMDFLSINPKTMHFLIDEALDVLKDGRQFNSGNDIDDYKVHVALDYFKFVTCLCYSGYKLVFSNSDLSFHLTDEAGNDLREWASLAMQTRGAMEAYKNFFWLIIDKVQDDDERFCRLLIWEKAGIIQKQRYFEDVMEESRKSSRKIMDEYNRRLERIRGDLKKSTFFNSEHFKKNYLKKLGGAKFWKSVKYFYHKEPDIIERVDLPFKIKKIYYSYGSDYAHAGPHALSQISDIHDVVKMNIPELIKSCHFLSKIFEHCVKIYPQLEKEIDYGVLEVFDLYQLIEGVQVEPITNENPE